MKKIFGVLIILIILGAIVYGVLSCFQGTSIIKVGLDNTPDLYDSVYPVYTSSRVYYAREYEWVSEKDIKLTGFYEVVGDKWVFRDGSTVMNSPAFGGITTGPLSTPPE